MRKLLLGLLLLWQVAAVGITPVGPKKQYFVYQLGFGVTEVGYSSLFESLFNSVELKDKHGFSGRLGIGWHLNSRFALESGLSFFPSVTRVMNRWSYSDFEYSKGTSKIDQLYGLDVLSVLTISKFLNLDLGVGASLIHAHYDSMTLTNSQDSFTEWSAGSKFFVSPKIELRWGKQIDSSTKIFVALSHIFSTRGEGTDSRNWQPSLSALTLGLQL